MIPERPGRMEHKAHRARKGLLGRPARRGTLDKMGPLARPEQMGHPVRMQQ